MCKRYTASIYTFISAGFAVYSVAIRNLDGKKKKKKNLSRMHVRFSQKDPSMIKTDARVSRMSGRNERARYIEARCKNQTGFVLFHAIYFSSAFQWTPLIS